MPKANKTINLHWGTCGDDSHWCSFRNLTLPLSKNPNGVYIIWIESELPVTVRVGQGNISDRIADHRNDSEIRKIELETGEHLRVTWASVPESSQDGVELFLGDLLLPLVGERFPVADPIEVNLPW